MSIDLTQLDDKNTVLHSASMPNDAGASPFVERTNTSCEPSADTSVNILFANDEVVLVQKPSGVLVHNNPSYAGAKELSLRQRLGTQLQRRVYPVHRLDRATSGILLFAKERTYVENLHQKLQKSSKRYIALVRGKSLVHEVLQHTVKNENGQRKDATTAIFPLLSSSTERCSLVGLQLQTGRRHQIRQHLKHKSHPIVGDTSYGKGDVNRHFRALGIHRLALHSLSLRGVLEEKDLVIAEVPEDLAQAFDLFLPASWREVVQEFAMGTFEFRMPLQTNEQGKALFDDLKDDLKEECA